MKKLIISLFLPFVAAFLGSLFTNPSIDTWYSTLVRPDIAPPNWVFGPVWTLLYLGMGIAFYLVWKSKSDLKKMAMWLFGIQLALNAIWSPVFFGANEILYALIIIVFLDVMVAATIYSFYKIDKRAAYLLLPYLLWILFATFLNYQFFLLN